VSARIRSCLASVVARVNPPAAIVLVVVLMAGCGGEEAKDLPEDVYPSPVPARPGTDLSPLSTACPNPAGLEGSAQLGVDAAVEVLNALLTPGDVGTQQRVTDPSYWPLLDVGRATRRLTADQVEVHSARDSPFAELLANGCGDQTVDATRWVKVCPDACPESESAAPGLVGHFFLIRREGHWLVWAGT